MSKRILIFDDDIDILSICTYILQEQGWDVQTSAHCNDIVNKVRTFDPNVILMDNWIPESGGVIATRAIKSEPDLKDIPVVYFSANNDIQTLAFKAGADTYLEKPFDLNELEDMIEKVARFKN